MDHRGLDGAPRWMEVTIMATERVPPDKPGLTSAELLAAQLCWAAADARQPGLRPIKSIFVGGSGSGNGLWPSGSSA